ncbi:MAG: helix-turn-helix domain-containing protein [Gemmatimonadota bacterium]
MADISVHDAATRLATSERTVRRYLASGQLAGTRTADGWTVSGQDLDRFLATRTVSPTTNGHAVTDMSAGMTELVRLVDRLQRENRDLAGLVGSLQERNANLEAQLALPTPSETPLGERYANDPGNTSTPTGPAPSRAYARAWWQFWRTSPVTQ